MSEREKAVLKAVLGKHIIWRNLLLNKAVDPPLKGILDERAGCDMCDGGSGCDATCGCDDE